MASTKSLLSSDNHERNNLLVNKKRNFVYVIERELSNEKEENRMSKTM